MPSSDGPMMALQMPGKAGRTLMLVVFTVWLSFAIGLNWGPVDESAFLALTGNTDAILHGQVWRLFTAPLLTLPMGSDGIWDLAMVLIGLYFFTPQLEELWGSWRLLRFIALTALFAYLLQMGIGLLLPGGVRERLIAPYWFGLTPALAGITMAWALTYKNQVVRLFFVVPVTSRMLVIAMVALALIAVVAGSQPPYGLISPFGGMLCGWLLGGGNPSPLRKAWLKLRLAQLEEQNARQARKKPRPNPGGLRVLPGGRADDDDDKGPDGRWLN